MTKQAIIHDGKLYIDENGYRVDLTECDTIIRMMHERIDGPPKPESHFAQADVDRWLAYECGGGPAFDKPLPYRIRTKPIIQGEPKASGLGCIGWIIGAILFLAIVSFFWF